MLRRDPVVLAWVLGLGLATLVYLVGPSQFLFRVADTLHLLAWQLGEFIADLSVMALDVVRALAIGLFATFLILGVAVARRGGPARGTMLIIILLFLVLVGTHFGEPGGKIRWTAALILSAAGAAVMTGRLRQAPPLAPTRY